MVDTLAIAPPPALARFVKSAQVIRGAALSAEILDGVRYERLPDGETEILVRSSARESVLHVVGTRTRALRKPPEQLGSAILLRFHPAGAYPFFGLPMSELTDRLVSIRTLWKGEGRVLEERLADSTSGAGSAAQLFSALAERLRSDAVFEPASALAVRRAVRRLSYAGELPSVVELAHQIGLGERQLRRAFDEVVGLTPKRYLRTLRFARVLGVVANGSPRDSARASTRPDWGAIAKAAGYFDQAHLIADFREMTGEPPAAFVERRGRMLAPCP